MSERKMSHKFSTRYNPLYATWHTMKERCYLKTYHKYPDYGGRGIKICDEWLGKEGFKNFCKWSLSYGWHRGLSLDRIDNDGDYCPDNCRWVTIEIQNNNKRTNRRVIFWDMEFTIPQLAQFVDVDYEYLRKCIIDNNMAINDAVDKSVEKAKPYVPYRQLNSVVKKRKSRKRITA